MTMIAITLRRLAFRVEARPAHQNVLNDTPFSCVFPIIATFSFFPLNALSKLAIVGKIWFLIVLYLDSRLELPALVALVFSAAEVVPPLDIA